MNEWQVEIKQKGNDNIVKLPVIKTKNIKEYVNTKFKVVLVKHFKNNNIRLESLLHYYKTANDEYNECFGIYTVSGAVYEIRIVKL
jgi:5'(3')-deoxyribonucleotidase